MIKLGCQWDIFSGHIRWADTVIARADSAWAKHKGKVVDDKDMHFDIVFIPH
jgi:hypothetical protein